MDFGAAVAGIVRPIVAELRALRLMWTGHVQDIDADEPWYFDGSVTLAAATAAPTSVFAVPLLPRYAGVMDAFACELESGAWASSAGAGGVSFSVSVGGMALPGLQTINGPWGFGGARLPIHVRFGPTAQLEVFARNTHTTLAAEVCAQGTGYHFKKLAPALDGVGPHLAGGR